MLVPGAGTKRRDGRAAEQPFEAVHALVNSIERRYAGMHHNRQKWMTSTRKAWLVKTHKEGRDATSRLRQSRKRKAT